MPKITSEEQKKKKKDREIMEQTGSFPTDRGTAKYVARERAKLAGLPEPVIKEGLINPEETPEEMKAAQEIKAAAPEAMQQKEKIRQELMMPEEINIEKEKTLTEKTAELGLQPAAAGANIIGGALNRITNLPKELGLGFGGNVYTPQTAEQLAQTTAGKVIGGTTALVGGALALTGLSSVIGATGIKAAGLRLSAGSLLTGGGVLGVFNVKQKFSEAKGIISDSITQSSEIISNYQKGLISREDTISQFKKIQRNIRDAEASIKIINQDKVQNFINGGRDAAIDISYAMDDIDAKREMLINALQLPQ